MTRRALIAVAALVGCAGMGCAGRYDRSPSKGAIYEGYHTCPKCDSLEGGIFGKGPIREFRSEAAERCIHDWQMVSRLRFQSLATEQFGKDWSSEIPFWLPVVYEDGIDGREAGIIAEDYYLATRRDACGSLGTGSEESDYWAFPVYVGYAAKHYGDIHVHASTGQVEWHRR
jgi:hypothetical protein